MAKENKECPECGSFNVVVNEKQGKIICQDCSLIYEPLVPEDDKKLRK